MPSAKTIAIFSTKGGVGKTLIAANLAVSIAKDQGKKVALLDLDTQAPGDMARMLNISPSYNFLDAIVGLKKQPPVASIREFMLKLPDLKIDFLAAVSRPRQSVHLEEKYISDVFAMLNKEYDYVIMDVGKGFSEMLFYAFNQSNLVLLVVTPDILSVYQTKWSLDVLQSLHFPLKMVKLLLNRSESVGGVTWQEVRAALPCEILAKIPSEGKAVGYSVNRRVPIVIDAPRSKVSNVIKGLGKVLVEKADLYIEHQEVALERARESVLAKEGDFWRRLGLAEPLRLAERVESERDEVIILKKRVHQRIIEELDLKRLDLNTIDPNKVSQIKEKTEKAVSNALAAETGAFLSSFEVRKRLIKEITDEALGLGPLEDLISDPDITDIMVNNKDQIYIERRGRIELTSKRFLSDDQVRQIIERIIAPLGRHIDESTPMVDARLPDGSRVNAIIPPLSLTGPMLTIRKFGVERFNINDLLRFGTLSEQMKDFLKICVIVRKNLIVSGGTGSGKTTVLNVLSEFIPENERIITIEDAAELKLRQEHWGRLESRPPNIEGKGGISIRELFRNTLRMRPDRVIIGECRGPESLDMLQAMNTGHDGSLTTIHANSTHDVLSRLDSMILMSGAELPIRAIREMIASAVDIIVHTARLSDGSRKIMQITEITGMKDDVHIDMADIFTFKQTGLDKDGRITGTYIPTGYIPSFIEEIKSHGVEVPDNLFKQ
ncbi:MAG: ATPase, T2SS/T4P/T4SS family [Candidatus Omnitrophica bacterium]|nr:ATPase, T2SS/T4P/T4SS family [Candidatus Omnitrophota bacterium]